MLRYISHLLTIHNLSLERLSQDEARNGQKKTIPIPITKVPGVKSFGALNNVAPTFPQGFQASFSIDRKKLLYL